MSRHVTIGTAGHVDHGKTALVRMLTGVDTDRWAEEKRRGITMDLGFAPLSLGGGLTASIVDVPGHEDFVRNMVAGAAGIDVALLVVAADEGVMPQTVEHLAILEFLGVAAGAVAITKADLADADWLALVREDLAGRLEATAITWQPPVPCSVVTGRGGEELVDAIRSAARGARARVRDDLFRLPIDRVFSVAGAGTVVTGTSWSGTVAVGDAVRVLPGEHRSRVRGIQVHDQPRDVAEPGRRTALALPELDKAAVRRGAVVVTDDAWRATTSLDVLLRLLPRARPLTQRARVRLHLGTAEVLARVTPAGGDIAPGTTAGARLRLETPVVARWGDRGVIRSYSPVTTIGGCVVVDPSPSARPRRPQRVEERAAADPGARLAAFVHAAPPAGIARPELAVRLGLGPRDAETAAAAAGANGVALLGDRFVRSEAVERARRRTLEALASYHRERPLERGMPLERLRTAAGESALAVHVHATLAAEGALVMEGGVARLPGHAAVVPPHEAEAAARLRAALAAAGPQGLEAAEAPGEIDAVRARRLLEHFVREGSARRVRERYYDPAQLAALVADIQDEIRARDRATPAHLRQRTGLTRKTLIPLLEWMDEAGHTRREGDYRVLGPQASGAP